MPLFGDLIAHSLAVVGLTEQRYRRIKRLLHLQPACRCSYSRDLLNLLHQQARQHGWLKAIRNFREIKRYLDEPR